MPSRSAPRSIRSKRCGWISQEYSVPRSCICRAAAKLLPARRRAAVKHAHTQLDAGNSHGKMGRRVLHIHAPLMEGSRLLHRAGDRQAARQPRMRLRTGQLLQQRRGIAAQWIDLQHGLRRFVVGLQNALRLLPAELRQKQAHDGLRVAVAQTQVVRQRQRHGPQQIAQHAVDQTAACWLARRRVCSTASFTAAEGGIRSRKQS